MVKTIKDKIADGTIMIPDGYQLYQDCFASVGVNRYIGDLHAYDFKKKEFIVDCIQEVNVARGYYINYNRATMEMRGNYELIENSNVIILQKLGAVLPTDIKRQEDCFYGG